MQKYVENALAIANDMKTGPGLDASQFVNRLCRCGSVIRIQRFEEQFGTIFEFDPPA